VFREINFILKTNLKKSNKMFQRLHIVIIFSSIFLNITYGKITIKKCCKQTEMLNLENFQCLPKENFSPVNETQNIFPSIVLNFLVKPGKKRQVDNTFFDEENNLSTSPGFPKCSNNNNNNGFQVLNLNDGGQV